MTSVQNHQQLLNGNRLFSVVLLIFGLLFLSACGGSDKATKRTSNTKTRTTKKTTSKTRKNTDRTTAMPPRGSKNDTETAIEVEQKDQDPSDLSPMKGIYNVSILIPLDAQKYASSSISSSATAMKFTNFYSGVMIALQELEDEGVKLNVNIFDTKDKTIAELLRDPELKNSDVVIGPYDNKELTQVADWAKKEKVLLVSPWKSSSKITKLNNYYLQLLPTLDDHYEKMVYSVLDQYQPENIYLLGRDTKKDQARMRKLQIIAAKKLGIRKKPFPEFALEMDSLITGETAYDSIFFNQENSAYLLPNWSSEDEDFIYSSLRKMNSEKGLSNVKVFGMPILLESDKIEFDFYKNLKLQVVKSNFVDVQNPLVQNFKRTYFNLNDALPTKDAFHGYDTMKFVAESLTNYGARFHLNPNMQGQSYLQNQYEIIPVYEDEKAEKKKINYYANKNIGVIEFRNSKFGRK